MSPIIGHHTEMRRGPHIQSDNPILGMFGQILSHLKPVGIYPPIDDDLYQICLYPSDAVVFGMIGLFPGLNKMVEYIPAVTSSKHLTFNNMPCVVQGIVRQVEPKLLTDIGAPIERWEELRQTGDIWFLDLTDDYSEVNPIDDGVTPEIWGGLYASGHIEIVNGELNQKLLHDGMADAIGSAGFEPYITQNEAARKEIMIYGVGIRAVIDTQVPLYSIHMDAELGIEYASNKEKFDKVVKTYLTVIEEVAKNSSAEIANLHDLDFTYTDSENSYSVLRSLGSNLIADPVGVAIRNWHRKRSNKNV
jgi:hypothetical protein